MRVKVVSRSHLAAASQHHRALCYTDCVQGSWPGGSNGSDSNSNSNGFDEDHDNDNDGATFNDSIPNPTSKPH